MKKVAFFIIFLFTVLSLRAAGNDAAGLLASAGIKENLSMSWLFGTLIFGAVGVFAFLYGKKKANPVFMVIGVLLMAYPYVVKDTLLVYIVGTALSSALYFFRK